MNFFLIFFTLSSLSKFNCFNDTDFLLDEILDYQEIDENNFENNLNVFQYDNFQTQPNDDDKFVDIKFTNCDVKKCNQNISSDIYFVDCELVNFDLVCLYCKENYILNNRVCVGPCENLESCNIFDCPSNYVKDEFNFNLCLKKDNIKDKQPLSISYFKVNDWNFINETTLIHQIDKNSFNLTDDINLGLDIEKRLPISNTEDFYLKDEDDLINLYLKPHNINEAIVSIYFKFKDFILHKTELHFI